MERRFRVRFDELLDDAEVHPSVMPRLESLLQPLVAALSNASLTTGFLTRETGGGKKRTQALTVPPVQAMIAGLLDRLLNCHGPERIRRNMNRRLKRNEEARLYHWRRRNRLPPQRFEQRT